MQRRDQGRRSWPVADAAAQRRGVTTCTRAGHHLRLLQAAGRRRSSRTTSQAEGKVVDRSLCEHFPLTRQELFDVVAVHGYTQLRRDRRGARHRPRLRHLQAGDRLDPGHASSTGTCSTASNRTLQDTNDAYLANIQRNGTYSVVPRIPGGEITPEKLIVIGEVARDFGLYTKITGGQRIDLFGARMEQLPAIWRRLVDAGFESGHAYGKALRTVKSCVGSTWCRYGVQDSVQLAIELELRYRGLRSPHKLKGGGQRLRPRVRRGARQGLRRDRHREGLEPLRRRQRRRDAGARAAARRRPRHARRWSATSTGSSCTTSAPPTGCSAPRPGSTRSTAASTGSARSSSTTRSASARELEAAMARHVDGYFDEWKATLEDPEKLARFVSFVNAPDTPDPHISFRAERGQPVPADSDGPVSLGATIPVGAPRDARSTDRDVPVVCRLDDIEVEGGVAALVDGAAVAIFRTHDGNVYAIVQLRPLLQGLGAGPRHRRHPRRSVPFVASPMHKQAFDLRTGQCLDDAAVRVPTYDVRVDATGWCSSARRRRVHDRSPTEPLPLAGFRIGVTAARKVDEQVAPARAARRRGRVGAGAVARPEPGRRRRSCGPRPRRCWPAGRHVPGDHRHRHEGVVRGRRALGAADDLLAALAAAEILARGPKSVGALRRRGLRELWAPESECFEDVLEHLRGRDAGRAADRRAGARPVAVDGRARAAPAGRRRHHGDGLPGRRRPTTRSRCSS